MSRDVQQHQETTGTNASANERAEWMISTTLSKERNNSYPNTPPGTTQVTVEKLPTTKGNLFTVFDVRAVAGRTLTQSDINGFELKRKKRDEEEKTRASKVKSDTEGQSRELSNMRQINLLWIMKNKNNQARYPRQGIRDYEKEKEINDERARKRNDDYCGINILVKLSYVRFLKQFAPILSDFEKNNLRKAVKILLSDLVIIRSSYALPAENSLTQIWNLCLFSTVFLPIPNRPTDEASVMKQDLVQKSPAEIKKAHEQIPQNYFWGYMRLTEERKKELYDSNYRSDLSL